MSAVDWVLLTNDAVSVGDLVSTEAGGMPIYRVVAVANGQAWLQPEHGPAVQLMPLDRFFWKAAALSDAED
jgi:hypothetical protein